jgi:predicted amidohydrolase YtcJ
MLHSVWCAGNRVSRSGKPIGPEQAVPVYEALRAVTANAAYAYFEEDRKGTLEAGKLADMVILDRSPLAVDPMELRDIRVMETIKEGKTLYRRAEG